MRLIINTFAHSKAELLQCVEVSAQAVTVEGLREATRYVLRLDGAVEVTAHIDDIPLEALPDGLSWIWDSGFCVGAARLDFISSKGAIVATATLDIASDDNKLSASALSGMLDDLLRWAPEQMVGDSQTALSVGSRGTFSAKVQYERLRRYGPLFCEAVSECQRDPHVNFEPRVQKISLDRVRRPSRQMLTDPRVVAYRVSMTRGAHDRPPPLVNAEKVSATVDTLANRSLLTQTQKVLRRVDRLCELLYEKQADTDDATLRQNKRRAQILEGIALELKRSIAWFTRAGVSEGQSFADGLAQMSRIPSYSRAVRFGKLACSESFSAFKENEAALPLNSSWGLYEQWCFEQTRRLIESLVGASATRVAQHSVTRTDACIFQCEGVKITLASQVTFPSGSSPCRQARRHSLSRERRPDAILIVEDEQGMRWYVFDAKYRRNKANLLDAMASAHIYRDSLLLDGKRCSGALLLAPGTAFDNSWTLFTPEHWAAYHTGVVPEFRPEGQGLRMMQSWLAYLLGQLCATSRKDDSVDQDTIDS